MTASAHDTRVRPGPASAAGAPVLTRPSVPDRPASPERWRSVRRLVLPLLALAVVLTGALQVRTLPWASVVADVQWRWVALAAGCAGVSFLGAAWNLRGFAPARVGLATTVAAQLAATSVKVVTPAGAGALAVNVRLLQRAGSSTAASVAAVAGSQVAQVLVTAAVLVVIACLPGHDVRLVPEVPAAAWAGVGAVAVVAVGVLGWLLRRHRGWAQSHLQRSVPALRGVLASPCRSAQAVGGAVLLSAGLVGVLWASTSAFGAVTDPLDVAVVLLIGAWVGSAVPTPGGTGGVEVVLTGGLVALGVPAAVAVPAVLVHRLLTLWLAVPVGLVAGARLRAAGAL